MVVCQSALGSAGITANVPMLYEGGEIDAHLVSLAQMTNSSTNFQFNKAVKHKKKWQKRTDIFS
jgi:hypothetical protein